MTAGNHEVESLKEYLDRLDQIIQVTLNTVQGAASKTLSLPPTLFSGSDKNIASSRTELERTYQYICEQTHRNSHRNKSETNLQYYCERFTEQYTAICRSLEHLKLVGIKQNRRTADRYRRQVTTLLAPSHKLHQDLAQHHEYERRLMDMLRDKQAINNKAVDQALLTNEILTLKARLGRCRQAIARIEEAIKSVEQGR